MRLCIGAVLVCLIYGLILSEVVTGVPRTGNRRMTDNGEVVSRIIKGKGRGSMDNTITTKMGAYHGENGSVRTTRAFSIAARKFRKRAMIIGGIAILFVLILTIVSVIYWKILVRRKKKAYLDTGDNLGKVALDDEGKGKLQVEVEVQPKGVSDKLKEKGDSNRVKGSEDVKEVKVDGDKKDKKDDSDKLLVKDMSSSDDGSEKEIKSRDRTLSDMLRGGDPKEISTDFMECGIFSIDMIRKRLEGYFTYANGVVGDEMADEYLPGLAISPETEELEIGTGWSHNKCQKNMDDNNGVLNPSENDCPLDGKKANIRTWTFLGTSPSKLSPPIYSRLPLKIEGFDGTAPSPYRIAAAMEGQSKLIMEDLFRQYHVRDIDKSLEIGDECIGMINKGVISYIKTSINEIVTLRSTLNQRVSGLLEVMKKAESENSDISKLLISLSKWGDNRVKLVGRNIRQILNSIELAESKFKLLEQYTARKAIEHLSRPLTRVHNEIEVHLNNADKYQNDLSNEIPKLLAKKLSRPKEAVRWLSSARKSGDGLDMHLAETYATVTLGKQSLMNAGQELKKTNDRISEWSSHRQDTISREIDTVCRPLEKESPGSFQRLLNQFNGEKTASSYTPSEKFNHYVKIILPGLTPKEYEYVGIIASTGIESNEK